MTPRPLSTALAALLLAPLLTLASCSAQGAPVPVTVGAAASLRELCEAARPLFEAAHPGTTLRFSFDASSTLARQVEAGGALHAFLSADAENVERVRSRAADGTITRFLANRLVLVARADLDPAPASPAALAKLPGRIALAGPAVPAGRYARRYLEKRGLLAALEPRIVSAETARAALALVESGAADAGFVYQTDLRIGRRSRLLFAVPPEDDPGIVYVACAVRGEGAAARAAADFVRWLRGEPFQARARALGFLPPPP